MKNVNSVIQTDMVASINNQSTNNNPLNAIQMEEMNYNYYHDLYCDMLDMCNEPVRIGNGEYRPSEVLKETDPIAFRTGFHEYIDALGYELD